MGGRPLAGFQQVGIDVRYKEHADTVDEGGHAALRARLDVSQALAALPEKLRDVVVLSVYQGMRYRDIGAILKIPEGTVKSRMHAAVRRLRGLLGRREDDLAG